MIAGGTLRRTRREAGREEGEEAEDGGEGEAMVIGIFLSFCGDRKVGGHCAEKRECLLSILRPALYRSGSQ